jgi:16S rRNA processing protein RimM
MDVAEARLLNVGKIVNTHGVRGEIKVWPQTDFPDVRFRPGSRLLLVPPDSGAPFAVEVQGAREHKNLYIVKLKGFDDINGVEKYKGGQLKVGADDRVELEEGEYYVQDIVGCRVVTEDGAELGAVSDVLTPGANDVWVVKRPDGKELLLPVIDDVVLDVNVSDRVVTVHLLEGLL